MAFVAWCERLWLRSAPYSRLAAYVAAALVSAPVLYHILNHSTAYLGLLEDDHFYYATVADNLVRLGKLTYDGATLTNGFHPLWFAIVVALRAVCGGLGSSFYVALTVLATVSMVMTYELGRRYALRLGASAVLAAAIAALYALGCARLMATGMECVVAVPLFMWWLLELARPEAMTSRRAARLGCIASLAVLGRLDIAIAVALTIAGYLICVRPALRHFGRWLLAFAAGAVALPVYLLVNWAYFGTPLPVSALAKRLVTLHGFSFAYARAVAFQTYFGPTIAVVLPLGAVALYLLWRRDKRWCAARFSGAVALIFALLFFFLNALSGWIFFGWYAYPLAPAMIAAPVFICQLWARYFSGATARCSAQMAMLALVAFVPAAAALFYVEHGPKWSIRDNTLLSMSYELSAHMHEHEGLYAMGACAGVAAYVVAKPVLQLEGIITDRRMVEHVRNQDRLQDVLREYHADYLIVSLVGTAAQRRNGCYVVTQPDAQWAGRRTAKMSGAICSEPVEHFFTEPGSNPWSIFPRIETFVWDVKRARWDDPGSQQALAASPPNRQPRGE
jgi:hypothetical protein